VLGLVQIAGYIGSFFTDFGHFVAEGGAAGRVQQVGIQEGERTDQPGDVDVSMNRCYFKTVSLMSWPKRRTE
jgi:hypothetical protein